MSLPRKTKIKYREWLLSKSNYFIKKYYQKYYANKYVNIYRDTNFKTF